MTKIKFKGALVGGPDNKDEYKDDRNNYEQTLRTRWTIMLVFKVKIDLTPW